MSQLIVASEHELPSTIEDLSRFVLVGREKLVAVRAEIRAIDKVGLAQEVRSQKLREAQDISEAVLDAEVRIGELMAKVPKAKNQYDDALNNGVISTKADVIKEAGFTPMQVSRFETLAAHPDIVAQAKAEARENEEIVTRSSVLEMVREQKTPHVANNSGNNEWYTPEQYIELAREVLGVIDLDPASCEYANETVKASTFYTEQDDGLTKDWRGRVWMNPPYSADLIGRFTEKFVDEYEAGSITEGIVLVNNATETSWFANLAKSASAVVFPRGRIRYSSPTRDSLAPLQGQAFLYFGEDSEHFLNVFSKIGWGALVYG